MTHSSAKLVLGSRSPRRLALLKRLAPHITIEVRPPADATEASFDNVHSLEQIEQQLLQIARQKCEDVAQQISSQQSDSLILTADTIIVARNADHLPVVLGQPPETDNWQATVRHWFRDYLLGKTHSVLTALCVQPVPRERIEHIVRTDVTFRDDAEDLLEWYLATEEPRGKAGGYAIQELGSLFVSRMEGSLTNVVGLPLECLRDVLTSLELNLNPPTES
ncbi:MAG: Maf family protein [Planctomycetaceae bacterium]